MRRHPRRNWDVVVVVAVAVAVVFVSAPMTDFSEVEEEGRAPVMIMEECGEEDGDV